MIYFTRSRERTIFFSGPDGREHGVVSVIDVREPGRVRFRIAV